MAVYRTTSKSIPNKFSLSHTQQTLAREREGTLPMSAPPTLTPAAVVGDTSLEVTEWALLTIAALPVLSLMEYGISSFLIEKGVCKPCICSWLKTWNLHGDVPEGEGVLTKPPAPDEAPINPSSFAGMQGVPFVDAEAGERDAEEDSTDKRNNTYKRKKKGQMPSEGAPASADGKDSSGKPFNVRGSFSGLLPFGRKKAQPEG